ncbi:hypothetical protein GCM10017667_21470 [Streptomyces filamentosus]|uniref:Uncharacterized protein n=1 Tax=Streptomyces filamentosus TaxID=67294 RepID=A0A919BI24_STRFL|nr:hypothetical protein GCM10017667_21470 [Streptomyces filamentosus]
MRGMVWVAGSRVETAAPGAAEESRTAWRSPVAPGVAFPDQTTGRRRGAPAPPAAPERAPARGFAANFGEGAGASRTRKLAWFTITWAGSESTLTMLREG